MRRAAGRNFVVAVALATGLAACGGGTRQDVNQPSGSFTVQVPTASFPTHQQLAERARLVIAVRNTSGRTLPNVAVTICNTTCTYPAPVGEGTSVRPFAYYLKMPGLVSHSRPVWIVDKPPGACGYSCQNGGRGTDFTADANTWAAGQLKPGATATFSWDVTAVVSGKYTVAWQVAAGIYGKAKAVLADGTIPHGAFTVNIAHAPAKSFVNDQGGIVKSQ